MEIKVTLGKLENKVECHNVFVLNSQGTVEHLVQLPVKTYTQRQAIKYAKSVAGI